MNLKRKCAAEALGTSLLVYLFGASFLFFPGAGGPSAPLIAMLTAGLTLTSLGYGLGHISQGQFNPAVTLGLHLAGRLPAQTARRFILAQTLGALAGMTLVAAIALEKAGSNLSIASLASGYGDHSPGGFGLGGVLLGEAISTFFLVLVVLGATDGRAPQRLAPLASGLAFAAVQMASASLTYGVAHPALSTATALWSGTPALLQLWVFWVSPLLGAYGAAKAYRRLSRMH